MTSPQRRYARSCRLIIIVAVVGVLAGCGLGGSQPANDYSGYTYYAKRDSVPVLAQDVADPLGAELRSKDTGKITDAVTLLTNPPGNSANATGIGLQEAGYLNVGYCRDTESFADLVSVVAAKFGNSMVYAIGNPKTSTS